MKNVVLLLLAAGVVFAQIPDPGYGSAPPLSAQFARGLVYRTQIDLRHAVDFERHHGLGKEVARYENAERHLSDFDRRMTRGHYDTGKLDIAINDVKNVVEHNTLDPNERDALSNDLMNLQEMRLHHP
jgi:hypothetical protein